LLPRIQGDPGIEDELEQEFGPGGMAHERVVHLGRDFAYFRKAVPRYGWEVVVFVVVADVERDQIQEAVVAISFLGRRNEVMLLNPAGAQGMQAHREQEGCQQISKGSRSDIRVDRDIKGELYKNVEDNPTVEHADFAEPRRPGHLEKR